MHLMNRRTHIVLGASKVVGLHINAEEIKCLFMS